MSDRDQIEQIKDRLDIVAVIHEYVPTLKKSGHNFFGLCPFHQEGTPSFSVNPDLGIYKCFGCGEGGDVIKFIEKIEGLDFPKALELAAKRAGIVLQRNTSPQAQKYREEKDRLLDANKLTAQFWHYVLMQHKLGEPAREYVKGRLLRQEELELFQIGFAPDGFQHLHEFLNKRGFKDSELIAWGLLVNKNGRTYDKFRKRLMFPIFSHQGDIVGFSGRVIDKNDLGPKYLNSPETLVYHKSELLYGLYQAKEAIRKNSFVILVEGNVDILSSHGKGIGNIVAPLGTALTQDQLKLIKRYADTIYFSFDTDAAGEKALFRGLELAEKEGIKTKALNLGEYQDADELIRKGADWKEVVDHAQEVVEHIMNRLKTEYDLKSADGKDEYARIILRWISKLTSNIQIAEYLKRLGAIIGIDGNVLNGELEKLRSVPQQSSTEPALQVKRLKLSSEDQLLIMLYNHQQWVAKTKQDWFQGIFTAPAQEQLLNMLLSNTLPKDPAELPPDAGDLFALVTLAPSEVFDDPDAFLLAIRKQTILLRMRKIKEMLRSPNDDPGPLIKEKGILDKQLRTINQKGSLLL